jgi:hypothetical protein
MVIGPVCGKITFTSILLGGINPTSTVMMRGQDDQA